MAVPQTEQLRTLCEGHACIPTLRCETRDGRVYASLSAVTKAFPPATQYDIRTDTAWDDGFDPAPLLTQALAEWWS